jgi:hypothetical protein
MNGCWVFGVLVVRCSWLVARSLGGLWFALGPAILLGTGIANYESFEKITVVLSALGSSLG